MDWYNEEIAVKDGDIKVSDIEELCRKIYEARQECTRVNDLKSATDAACKSLELKLVGVLEQLGKTSYDTTDARFGVSYRSTVCLPQGDDRESFFSYLKEKGEFDSLISVNSATLNAWYKNKEQAAREAKDLDFKIPGITEPEMVPILSVKKKQ